MADLKTLIIIPARNEAENLKTLLPEIIEHCPFADALVMNDGSTDETARIARTHGMKVLDFAGVGIGEIMQAGFLYALENNYDMAIQVDGDGQHDPIWVPDIAGLIMADKAD